MWNLSPRSHVRFTSCIVDLLYFRNLQSRFTFGKGSWIGLWAVWYGSQRAVLDTLRFGMGDSTIGSFTWNQIGGLMLAIIGLLIFLRNKDFKTN